LFFEVRTPGDFPKSEASTSSKPLQLRINMIARLIASLALLAHTVLASVHLRQKVTTIRHAHRHHRHHEALLQESGAHAAAHAAAHATNQPVNVFANTADLPPVGVPGVVSSGIVENAGNFKDEVAAGNAPPAVNNPPAALVASRAASTRQQAPTASDDSDGGDASDFIDGPGASDQQETLTREDMMEAQGVNTPSNSLSAPLPNQPAMIQQPVQETPRQASTAAMVQTKSAAGQPTGITRPKGWDQCLKFARYVKSQDVTGVELIRVWKSTCEPAVQSGSATERYRLMCNSLGGAVEPFAAQLDYNVENLCDSVLAVFHDVTAVDAKAR